jgi:hypothetical protein
VPRSASIEAEDELVQVVLKVDPAQAVIDAQTPALEVGEQANPATASTSIAPGRGVIEAYDGARYVVATGVLALIGELLGRAAH